VTRVEIRVLGGFEVSVDARRVPPQAWQQRRASDLVKLLALTTRHRLHREQVIDALWPDLPPDAGAANLRMSPLLLTARSGSWLEQ
jgi:DNA-binding SARP family transcriptional activator